MTTKTKQQKKQLECRKIIDEALEDLHHVLSWQSPIKDFVHRNILQGLEQQEFTEALQTVNKSIGARGFMPIEDYRGYYQQGRINDHDLSTVLDNDESLQPTKQIPCCEIKALDIYKIAMRYPLKSLTSCQFLWQTTEKDILNQPQANLDPIIKKKYQQKKESIQLLWQACLTELGLSHHLLHPEDMIDLSPNMIEKMMDTLSKGAHDTDSIIVKGLIRKESFKILSGLVDRIGRDMTLSGFLKTITEHDIVEELRPDLLKMLASYLDMGLAAWHDKTSEDSFYASWRRHADHDYAWLFEALPDWSDHLDSLPDDPVDIIIAELQRLGLKQEKWRDYLEVMALELPGWSAMFLWHHLNPEHPDLPHKEVEMADYLAVRLILEHVFAQRLCAEYWAEGADLDVLIHYFHQHPAEFIVRYTIHNHHLPEYLVTLAHQVSEHTVDGNLGDDAWWRLADMIFTWQQSPAAIQAKGQSVLDSGWRVFLLCQHLGLMAEDVCELGKEGLTAMLACVDQLDQQKMGFLWLQAYEHHYREILFNSLIANHGKQPARIADASVQLIFCMDDREEGLRRHLEELDSSIETFGAAAHYGVPHLWQGMDDSCPTKKTPIVYDPVHLIKEHPLDGQQAIHRTRQKHQKSRQLLNHFIHNESRHRPFVASLFIALGAPFALINLASKIFFPLQTGLLKQWWMNKYEPAVIGRMNLSASKATKKQPTPSNPQMGFNDNEQLQRANAFLANIGLKAQFSSLIIIFGHGSSSQNNPHANAYGCGACSGKHSGENARILAAILNRPVIRQRLKDEHQIEIPEQTWFIGGEHNTANEAIRLDDMDLLPKALHPIYQKINKTLLEAQYLHADERCRRFASAPKRRTPKQAFYHMLGRTMDFSQARPELGHTNNAAAIIGRRAITRGVFYDRRLFLISYDPDTDPTGTVLEGLLLANAPVGAGISLDYYFSTVDNQHLGSGSKITHNVVGNFAVMDGTASDLRTGLPKQMIEIHEAMRLQIVVESTIERVTEIYQRQKSLQELIGNGWLLVSVMDQNTGEIQVFDPKKGFSPWTGQQYPLKEYKTSQQCYQDSSDPLDPALIHSKVTSHA